MADIVSLRDGRKLEGVVLSQEGEQIQFDTVISGIRARVTFKKSDVASIEEKPVPEGFFEAAEGGHGPEAAGSQAVNLYLEIPVQGRLGETVFAQALRSTLAHAKLKGVKHIVFAVDSPGGAIDEAAAIYRTMLQFGDDLTYHSIVRSCTGTCLVIPFLSETIHLQPGGKVGGSDQPWDKLPRRFAAQEEAVARAQIADDLAAEARRRGRKGDIIRAMIDPSDALAAWQIAEGEIVTGAAVPEDVPADRVIFRNERGAVLVLTFEQASRLGVPSIDGGADKLGAVLGLSNWKEYSSYGRDAMNRAVAARQRRAANAQTKFEDNVTRNIRMRETTKRAIEHNLKQAATWNPTDASYAKLSAYWNAYWNPEATWTTNLWTPESQRRWRDRTEACLYFLARARDGVQSMMRLDKEAVSLGLSPTFQQQDLEFMLEDIRVKIDMLKRNRYRVGE